MLSYAYLIVFCMTLMHNCNTTYFFSM